MSLVQGDDEDTFEKGDLIDNRFTTVKRLGRGGYGPETETDKRVGEIYSCKDVKTGEMVAVKVERPAKPGNLIQEEAILRDLQACKWVPHIVVAGRHEGTTNYIAMELLGENLSDLRRARSKRHFSMLTTMMLAEGMLIALREVHEAGYVHRDIKPGNFVVGRHKTATRRGIFILDFGLSKKHLRKDGSAKPKAKAVKWGKMRRDLTNLCSKKEQGRRDDLWSLLYLLIELATGGLPWGHLRGIENMEKVREIKVQYNNKKLVKGLPELFITLFNYISSLKYDTRPDYDMLLILFREQFVSLGGNEDTPYDWETPEDVTIAKKLEMGVGLPHSIGDTSSSTSLETLASLITSSRDQTPSTSFASSLSKSAAPPKVASNLSPRVTSALVDSEEEGRKKDGCTVF